MSTDRGTGPQEKRFGNDLFPDGRYFFPRGGAGSTTKAVTANLLYAVPMVIGRPTLFTKMVHTITSGVAGFFRMGVYSHDEANAKPKDLMGIAAEQISDNAATLEPAFAYTLYDLVWLAVVYSVGPTVRALTASVEHGNAPLGSAANDPSASTDLAAGLRVAYTYAALPDPWPSSAITYLDAVSLPKLGLKT
jgi:hypothetical protein